MKRTALLLSGVLLLSCVFYAFGHVNKNTGAPPYSAGDDQPPENLDPYAWLKSWVRPEGPARVGLQVGHWKNAELPEELSRLLGNTGATGGGKSEWEVNYAIAEETAHILQTRGVQVDILPSTIPVKYWADVFVAIHADGNIDSSVRGFKIASPRRDFTNQASDLVEDIESSYAQATQLTIDPNVSRNMTGYYAFAWWRYDHAIHPMTTAAILETGFLSNPSDRRIIVSHPEISAQGLADGILAHLEERGLVKTQTDSPAVLEE